VDLKSKQARTEVAEIVEKARAAQSKINNYT
jgi:hypothetical protein